MSAGSVSDPDPFHFGGLPDPFYETDYTDTDQASKISAKIMENSNKKINQNHNFHNNITSNICIQQHLF